MATKAEVRQLVGEDLSLVPIGQDLEYQDQVRIDRAYDQVYLRLKKRGLATWASTAEVPEAAVPFYVLIMLESLLITYGVSGERYNRIKLEAGPQGETAIMSLAEAVLPNYQSADVETDY